MPLRQDLAAISRRPHERRARPDHVLVTELSPSTSSTPDDLSHTVRVLDAGCGNAASWKFDAERAAGVSLKGAHLTGLDIDGPALAENPRFDDRIVGSVETYPLPAE